MVVADIMAFILASTGRYIDMETSIAPLPFVIKGSLSLVAKLGDILKAVGSYAAIVFFIKVWAIFLASATFLPHQPQCCLFEARVVNFS